MLFLCNSLLAATSECLRPHSTKVPLLPQDDHSRPRVQTKLSTPEHPPPPGTRAYNLHAAAAVEVECCQEQMQKLEK